MTTSESRLSRTARMARSCSGRKARKPQGVLMTCLRLSRLWLGGIVGFSFELSQYPTGVQSSRLDAPGSPLVPGTGLVFSRTVVLKTTLTVGQLADRVWMVKVVRIGR